MEGAVLPIKLVQNTNSFVWIGFPCYRLRSELLIFPYIHFVTYITYDLLSTSVTILLKRHLFIQTVVYLVYHLIQLATVIIFLLCHHTAKICKWCFGESIQLNKWSAAVINQSGFLTHLRLLKKIHNMKRLSQIYQPTHFVYFNNRHV